MLPEFAASGLLLSSDLQRIGASERTLQRALERQALVRVRRGAYVDAVHWSGLDGRGRLLLRMRAVAEAASRDVIFCGFSAAAAWNLPFLGDWPDRVEVLCEPAQGGRSEWDVIRRPRELRGLRVNEVQGLLVTGAAVTVVDLSRRLAFAPAVGVVDAAMAGRAGQAVTRTDLLAELEREPSRRGRSAARSAIEFGVGVSDSFGESFARARLHELGYAPPELQVPIADGRGLVGVVDFFWPGLGIVGEFDGAVKYLREEFRGGRTAAEVVWREKQREDRLRRRTTGLFRLVWADLMDPPRMDGIVRSSGLRPVARV
ncbi:hypothetical protein [Naasia aerilata]|uniref:CTP synthase n=1 Tax=Naasia aerilata TaxID=1162966 RepID=A0ABM8G9T8_9MICO|nr:hypothetical protein [Naasia aerilata]BDZ44969.1 CTP synthase [Naasia aerilata]